MFRPMKFRAEEQTSSTEERISSLFDRRFRKTSCACLSSRSDFTSRSFLRICGNSFGWWGWQHYRDLSREKKKRATLQFLSSSDSGNDHFLLFQEDASRPDENRIDITTAESGASQGRRKTVMSLGFLNLGVVFLLGFRAWVRNPIFIFFRAVSLF